MLFRQIIFVVLCHYSLQAIPSANPTEGILFNYQQTILLAEKFVNIQVVLPFPRFDDSLSQYLTDIAAKLQELWHHPNFAVI